MGIKFNLPCDWKACYASLTERSIPNRQHAVTKPQHIFDNALVWLFEQVWLTSLGVDMGMCTEERREHSDTVPAYKHLWVRVPEETTDIS